jgi:hypothetical protein
MLRLQMDHMQKPLLVDKDGGLMEQHALREACPCVTWLTKIELPKDLTEVSAMRTDLELP